MREKSAFCIKNVLLHNGNTPYIMCAFHKHKHSFLPFEPASLEAQFFIELKKCNNSILIIFFSKINIRMYACVHFHSITLAATNHNFINLENINCMLIF